MPKSWNTEVTTKQVCKRVIVCWSLHYLWARDSRTCFPPPGGGDLASFGWSLTRGCSCYLESHKSYLLGLLWRDHQTMTTLGDFWECFLAMDNKIPENPEIYSPRVGHHVTSPQTLEALANRVWICRGEVAGVRWLRLLEKRSNRLKNSRSSLSFGEFLRLSPFQKERLNPPWEMTQGSGEFIFFSYLEFSPSPRRLDPWDISEKRFVLQHVGNYFQQTSSLHGAQLSVRNHCQFLTNAI